MHTPFMKVPCRLCPWRKDVPTDIWGAERFEKLRGCVEMPEPGAPLRNLVMLCHKSPGGEILPEAIEDERLTVPTMCAGWILVEGEHSFGARYVSILEKRDISEGVERPKVTEIYTSFDEMVDAQETP